jgi:predicted transcriptional regulator
LEAATALDIENCFREARLPIPNISDMIGKNLRAEHLVKRPEKKDGRTAYVITKKGEEYVNSWSQRGREVA